MTDVHRRRQASKVTELDGLLRAWVCMQRCVFEYVHTEGARVQMGIHLSVQR